MSDDLLVQLRKLRRRTAIMAIGMPRVGKSTYLQQLVGANYEIISSDSIHDVPAEPDGLAECEVRAEIRDRARAALRQGRHIVIDSTNTNRSLRVRDILLWRSLGARIVVAVFFDISLEVALMRNRASSSSYQVLTEAVERSYHQILATPPTLEEGFDYIYRIEV